MNFYVVRKRAVTHLVSSSVDDGKAPLADIFLDREVAYRPVARPTPRRRRGRGQLRCHRSGAGPGATLSTGRQPSYHRTRCESKDVVR